MIIVTGYDMQFTQQQRLAPEAPDESALYSPIVYAVIFGLRGRFGGKFTRDALPARSVRAQLFRPLFSHV